MSKELPLIPIDVYAENFFRLPNGEKIKLFPHQKKILRMMFDFDPETGKLPWTTCVYGAPKKSGKTQIAALVVSWFAFNMSERNDELLILANDKDHAAGRVYKAFTASVNSEPALKSELDGPTGQYITRTKRGVEVKALSGSYGGAAGALFSLVAFDELWCRSDKTQALTKDRGWVSYKDLRIGDFIAANKNGQFIWEKVKNINIQDYDGDMYSVDHRRMGFSMTPGHRVFGKFRNSGNIRLEDQEYSCKFAEEAASTYETLVCSRSDFWLGDSPNHIMGYNPEDFCSLFGWFISEGYVPNKENPTGFRISQSKVVNSEKYKEIAGLLEKMGLVFSEAIESFYIQNKELATFFANLGLSADKHLPDWFKNLNKNCLVAFFNSYIKGDGTIAGRGYQAFTKSDRLADDLVEIGSKIGYDVKYMNKRHVNRISFSKGNIVIQKKQWKKNRYVGKVWCPSIESGVWLSKEGPHVSWTGNCYEHESFQRLYDELTPIPTGKEIGRKNSVRFITTYAGFTGQSEILESVYKSGLAGECIDEDLNIWVNREAGLFMYWDHKGRLPWHTKEYYDEQRHSLRPMAFRRLHQNEWVANEEGINMDEWVACEKLSFLPEFEWSREQAHSPNKNIHLSVGVDVGLKRDSSAVVSCFRKKDKIWLGPYQIWHPSKENPLDLEETIERFILNLQKNFLLGPVYYDPFQFHRSAQILYQKGVRVIEYNQSPGNLTQIAQHLLDILKFQNLVLYPSEELKEQAQNVAIVEMSGARGYKIAKSEKRKNDAIVALAMAAYGAESVPTSSDDFSNSLMILR